MGGVIPTMPSEDSGTSQGPAKVTLHCYDFFKTNQGQALNGVLRKIGAGAFHCGVEVYGREWTYCGVSCGGTSGIYWITPKTARGELRESVVMGNTAMSEKEINTLVSSLKASWPASEYGMLTRNCLHFCDEFCRLTGVGPIPEWSRRLASTGQALHESLNGSATASCVGVEDESRRPWVPAQLSSRGNSRPNSRTVFVGPGDYKALVADTDGSPIPKAQPPLPAPRGLGVFSVCLASGLLGCFLLVLELRRWQGDHRHVRQGTAQGGGEVGRSQQLRAWPLACQEGAAGVAAWSDQRRAWCCERERQGCPFYDCEDGFQDWEHSWLEAKKVWCCHRSGMGCPIANNLGDVGHHEELPDAAAGGAVAPTAAGASAPYARSDTSNGSAVVAWSADRVATTASSPADLR